MTLDELWSARCASAWWAGLAPRTRVSMANRWANHISPHLGHMRVEAVGEAEVWGLLLAVLRDERRGKTGHRIGGSVSAQRAVQIVRGTIKWGVEHVEGVRPEPGLRRFKGGPLFGAPQSRRTAA